MCAVFINNFLIIIQAIIVFPKPIHPLKQNHCVHHNGIALIGSIGLVFNRMYLGGKSRSIYKIIIYTFAEIFNEHLIYNS